MYLLNSYNLTDFNFKMQIEERLRWRNMSDNINSDKHNSNPWGFPPSLLKEAFDGQPEAQALLWEKTLSTALTLAKIEGRKRGLARDGIEDVVQNSLLALYNLPPERLQAIKNWPGYLYRTITNKLTDEIRRRARRNKHVTASLDAPIGNDSDQENATLLSLLPGNETNPADAALLKDLVETIKSQVIDKLSKEKDEVFRLYLCGYKHKEIEDITGVKQNTVSVWIYRIKKTYCEWYKDHFCSE